MIKGSISNGQFTWNSTVRVIDGSSGEQWMPAISTNLDGVLSVLYYFSGSNANDPVYTYLKYSTDGGNTFLSLGNIGSTSGFVVPNVYFLGDYHGLTSWYGKAYPLWCEYKTDPTYNARQIYFRSVALPIPSPPSTHKKITGNQLDASGQSFEKIGKWNQGIFTDYKVPYTFLFALNANEVLRAKQDFKLSTYQKYNNWNNLSDVKNHHIFSIDANTSTLTSHFSASYSGISIQNNFEGTTINPSTDNIYFKDPWLVDYPDPDYDNNKRNRGMDTFGNDALIFKERPSPFSPNYSTSYNGDVYKGVFLNQNPNFLPSLPIYSIQAPQSVDFGGALGLRNVYLQDWSVSPSDGAAFQYPNADETAVVFNSSSATISANLKGHLLSGISTGLSTNSQRKIVADSYNYLHMVYESMGSIWYTRSTDAGATWTPEQNVNQYDGNAKCPSIACSNDGHDLIYITYQSTVDEFGFGNPSVILAQFQNGNLRWAYSVTTLSSYSYNTNPVITARSGGVFTLYKPSSSSGLIGKEFAISGAPGYTVTTVYSRGTLPNSDANSSNPSVVYGSYKYFLAFQQGYTAIKYSEWSFNTAYSDLVYTDITSGSGYPENHNPTITLVNGNPYVGWIGTIYSGAAQSAAIYKVKSGGSWGSLYSRTADYINSPFLSSTNNSNLIFVWSEQNGTYNKLLKYGSVKTLNTQGVNVQASNGATLSNAFAVSLKTTTQPFTLMISNNLYSIAKETLNNPDDIERRTISFINKEGEVYFSIRNLTADSSQINFNAVYDTTVINDKASLKKYLTSEIIDITNANWIAFDISCWSTDSVKAVKMLKNKFIEVKIDLVNAEKENEIIESFKRNLNSSINIDKNTVIKLSTKGIIPKLLKLKVDITYDDPSISLAMIRDSYSESFISKESTLPKKTESIESISTYDLTQNYPNPFNPSTIINYQMPEAGHTTLKIYDLLGKEVSTLVDEYKSEGRYSVEFNASNLTSGIYFYELRSGGYSSTKKMLLVR